jgi:hypothetical protein
MPKRRDPMSAMEHRGKRVELPKGMVRIVAIWSNSVKEQMAFFSVNLAILSDDVPFSRSASKRRPCRKNDGCYIKKACLSAQDVASLTFKRNGLKNGGFDVTAVPTVER